LLFANSSQYFYVPYIMRHLRMKKVLFLQEPSRFMYEAAPILPWASHASEDLEQSRLFRLGQFISDYPHLQNLRLRAKQEWLNVRACDQILVNSYFSRESVRRSYGVDSKVCYLGVDTKLFRNLGLPRERFIMGLGSFHSIKGIDLAVRAVALLPQPRPPLVWISNSGTQAYERQVQALAVSLGVDLQIQMGIPDAEVVTTLNKAALLLFTSRLEPFGFAPLEANACGLPVVAIPEGGVRETIQDGFNGFLVDSDPESIAAAAGRLLQNPALAREMGENAAAHVEHKWNVDDSIDRLESILLQTVATKAEQCVQPAANGWEQRPSLQNTAPGYLRELASSFRARRQNGSKIAEVLNFAQGARGWLTRKS
jgi:glycosyltransferase involved in cell wall biosynthesis